MKKLILLLLATAITTILTVSLPAESTSSNTVFADNGENQTAATPAAGGLADETFDVTEFLRLDDDDQAMEYLEQTERPPIQALILRVIEFATMVIGSIAMILLIVAGFRFMFSQGNDQKLTEAKDMVKYAIIGLAVAFLAYTIVTFVQSIFV